MARHSRWPRYLLTGLKVLGPAVALFLLVTAAGALSRFAGLPKQGTTRAFVAADLIDSSYQPRAISTQGVEVVSEVADIGQAKQIAVSAGRVLVAGTNQLLVVDRGDGHTHNLFADSVPSNSVLRRSVRGIISLKDDECWLVNYYGVLSLWSLDTPQPGPREIRYLAHGLQGAHWFGSNVVASRALPQSLFGVFGPTHRVRASVDLATGLCCDGPPIAVMDEIKQGGEPPLDRVHPDVAHYVNRTALAGVDGRGFVLAFLLDARINIYDETDATLRVSVAGPQHLRMDFAVARFEDTGRAAFRPSPDTTFAYVDVAANKDMIVGLYAGRPFGTHGPGGVFSGDTIHVFDWAGRLLTLFRLPVSLSHIALDPSSSTVYGTTSTGTQQLISFNVPIATTR